MFIRSIAISGFRCLTEVKLEFSPRYNLIYGANASGKTSLLEALAYLGRGKSFRGAPAASVIQHGAKELVLFASVRSGDKDVAIGVRNGRQSLETRVDGDGNGGLAALAAAFPLQVIDPDVHKLVAGGPEERRRFLDWMVFHVEHEYLQDWRRFRRVLKQRNALLKQRVSIRELRGWDEEFVLASERVHRQRESVLQRGVPVIERIAGEMLGGKVTFSYRRGWSEDESLDECLRQHQERDFQLGGSQIGPHRAEVVIQTDERRAKRLVSRGQQKLLASSLIIGGTQFVQEESGRRLCLLLDDPAAELDSDSLGRILRAATSLDSQLILTSLNPELISFPEKPRVFHVEHGNIRAVDS
ncbi:MAG: DNA replication/repair protein RecF [Pseudomonadota bacterium]